MASNITLEHAVTLFLGEYKATTARSFQQELKVMVPMLGGSRKLASIKPEHVLEYVNINILQRKYAPATKRKHIKTIKVFFNWCVKTGLLRTSPAQGVRNIRLPRAISREKAMTDTELAALVDELRYKTIPRDLALVLFLADTGCRRGGASGLRVEHLDLQNRRAVVTEKGDQERVVFFGEQCADALTRWLAYRRKRGHVEGGYLFSRDLEPIKPEAISLIIRRACRRAGIRVLSSHSLRHRKGHQFADSRIAPSIAATVLGHSDTAITVAHYYPSDLESARRAVSELETRVPDRPTQARTGGKILAFPGAQVTDVPDGFKECRNGDQCVNPKGQLLPSTAEYFYRRPDNGRLHNTCKACMHAARNKEG